MGSKKPSGRCSKKHTPPLLPPHAPGRETDLTSRPLCSKHTTLPYTPPWPRTPPSTARCSYLEQGDEVVRRGGEHVDEECEDPRPLQPLAAPPISQPQTSSFLNPHTELSRLSE